MTAQAPVHSPQPAQPAARAWVPRRSALATARRAADHSDEASANADAHAAHREAAIAHRAAARAHEERSRIAARASREASRATVAATSTFEDGADAPAGAKALRHAMVASIEGQDTAPDAETYADEPRARAAGHDRAADAHRAASSAHRRAARAMIRAARSDEEPPTPPNGGGKRWHHEGTASAARDLAARAARAGRRAYSAEMIGASFETVAEAWSAAADEGYLVAIAMAALGATKAEDAWSEAASAATRTVTWGNALARGEPGADAAQAEAVLAAHAANRSAVAETREALGRAR